jgi:hypothetical protein
MTLQELLLRSAGGTDIVSMLDLFQQLPEGEQDPDQQHWPMSVPLM